MKNRNLKMKRFGLIFLMLCGIAGATMTWRENSAMLSKFIHPQAVFDGYLIGGYTAEVSTDNAGITMWDGRAYRFGGSVDNDLGYEYEFLWSVKDVGVFTTTISGTARNLLKSADGFTDFTVVSTAIGGGNVQSLWRCLVDCGRNIVGGIDKRVLMWFEYTNGAYPRVWYSAEVLDADAGNTWTDLFGATCPAILHFHGAINVPNKGLYVFTGDNQPSTAQSILFCDNVGYTGTYTPDANSLTVLTDSAATGWNYAVVSAYDMTGRTIRNITDGSSGIITTGTTYTTLPCSAGLSGGTRNWWKKGDVYAVDSAVGHLITTPATWQTSSRWGLTAGTRAAWAANYSSAYVVGANDNKWRTVELVTCDNKTGYWINDGAPGAGGNSIYKIDFFATSTNHNGGTVTTLKSGGVLGYGWYGVGAKNGIAYIGTYSAANTGSGGFSTGFEAGCDQYAHLYAVNTITDECADVRRVPRSDYVPSIGRYPVSNRTFGFVMPLVEYNGEIFGEVTFANGIRGLTGLADVQGATYCGHVDRQLVAQTNIITNPNFATSINPDPTYVPGQTGWQVYVHELTFELGSSVIAPGNTVTGKTSGATAVVAASGVTITANAGWGGTTKGRLMLASCTGDFDFANDEILKVGATECATLRGGTTFEVIDDPTGGGGKVLKNRFEYTTAAPVSAIPYFRWQSASLTTADKNKLYGNMETFSCQFNVKSGSSPNLLTRLYLQPKASAGLMTNQTQASGAFVPASTQQGVWHFFSVSDFVPSGATVWYHFCYPHYATNDGLFGTIYFKDFQLVPGALPNQYIEQLPTTGGGGGIYGEKHGIYGN